MFTVARPQVAIATRTRGVGDWETQASDAAALDENSEAFYLRRLRAEALRSMYAPNVNAIVNHGANVTGGSSGGASGQSASSSSKSPLTLNGSDAEYSVGVGDAVSAPLDAIKVAEEAQEQLHSFWSSALSGTEIESNRVNNNQTNKQTNNNKHQMSISMTRKAYRHTDARFF